MRIEYRGYIISGELGCLDVLDLTGDLIDGCIYDVDDAKAYIDEYIGD